MTSHEDKWKFNGESLFISITNVFFASLILASFYGYVLDEERKKAKLEGEEKHYHRKELINYESIWKSLRKTSECQQKPFKMK